MGQFEPNDKYYDFCNNMMSLGIHDAEFLKWFWDKKYETCKSMLLVACSMMYEGWKGAKQ